MGNNYSSLVRYKYSFEYPKVGDFDLSEVQAFKIVDEESSQAAEEFLSDEKIFYVDCEGRCFGNELQELGTVQIATTSEYCFVFHVTKSKHCLNFLKRLFESDRVRKVFHDCSGDSAVLYANGIQLRNVDDTQIAHKIIQSRTGGMPVDRKTGPSLCDLCWTYCQKTIPKNKSRKSTGYANRWTDTDDLDNKMMKYAVVDVLALREIFDNMEGRFSRDSEYEALVNEQLQRKRIQVTECCSMKSNSRMEVEEPVDWGKIALGIGAAAVAGAVLVAAVSKAENEKKKKSSKNDECTIS